MLTAKICVLYEGDWTAELARYDVFGQFVASTFRSRRYLGIVALETDAFESVVAVIDEHETTDSLEVVERYDVPERGRTSATMLIRGYLSEFSPLQTLLYEGFLPLGPTTLENGRECFDLLLHDRSELAEAVSLLDEFGQTSVERVSTDFRREIVPSVAQWQELLSAIPPRQRELLTVALEQGYFDIPRETTLAEIAAEMDITKSTASNHLRRAERQLMEFLVPYIDLAMEEEPT